MPTLAEMRAQLTGSTGDAPSSSTSLAALRNSIAPPQPMGNEPHDTSAPGEPRPLLERMWQGATQFPAALADQTRGQLIGGLTGAAGWAGLADESTVREGQREVADANRRTGQDVNVPFAEGAAHLGGAVAPALIPGAGIPLMATEMGGQKFAEMQEAGAGPIASRAAGLGMGVLGAALPWLGKLAAPATDAAGQVAAMGTKAALEGIAKPFGGASAAEGIIADQIAAGAGRVVQGAAQGEAANLALGTTGAIGTAHQVLTLGQAGEFSDLVRECLDVDGSIGNRLRLGSKHDGTILHEDA